MGPHDSKSTIATRALFFLIAAIGGTALESCVTDVQSPGQFMHISTDTTGRVEACASSYLVDDAVIVHLLLVNRGTSTIRISPYDVIAVVEGSDEPRRVRVWQPEAFLRQRRAAEVAFEPPPSYQPCESRSIEDLSELVAEPPSPWHAALLQVTEIPPESYVLGAIALEDVETKTYRLTLPSLDVELELTPQAARSTDS